MNRHIFSLTILISAPSPNCAIYIIVSQAACKQNASKRYTEQVQFFFQYTLIDVARCSSAKLNISINVVATVTGKGRLTPSTHRFAQQSEFTPQDWRRGLHSPSLAATTATKAKTAKTTDLNNCICAKNVVVVLERI